MKTIASCIVLLLGAVFSYAAPEKDMNIIIKGSTHDDFIKNLAALNETLDGQLIQDLYSAVRCIDRHVASQKNQDISENQLDAYFVALASNRNVREILLTGAAVALSECYQLPQKENLLSGLDPDSDEYKTLRYLINQRSLGKYLLETYLNVQTPKAAKP